MVSISVCLTTNYDWVSTLLRYFKSFVFWNVRTVVAKERNQFLYGPSRRDIHASARDLGLDILEQWSMRMSQHTDETTSHQQLIASKET